MKTNIVVIGDAPLVMGFKLAGLEATVQATDKNYQEELEKLLAAKEHGIIITNERMFNSIDWRLKKRLDNTAFPVVVPVPDHTGVSTEGDEIRNLIKRALGFDLGAKK
jgi:vacuolar-type H+-ATPase subunit F/Vma7